MTIIIIIIIINIASYTAYSYITLWMHLFNYTCSSSTHSVVANESSCSTPIKSLNDSWRKSKNLKKKFRSSMDDVEKQLISTIKNLDDTKPDEEGAFGDSVAARLRCLSPRQKAVAYIEIDKVLLRLKYPNDPYLNRAPSAPYQYYSGHQHQPVLSSHPQHMSFRPLTAHASLQLPSASNHLPTAITEESTTNDMQDNLEYSQY